MRRMPLLPEQFERLSTHSSVGPYPAKRLLHVGARDLADLDTFSKSDPFCVVYTRDTSYGEWHELGRTETIMDCLSPAWVRSFELACATSADRETQIRAVVYHNCNLRSNKLNDHSLIGECELRWVDILEGEHGFVEMQLTSTKRRNPGCLAFQWEDVQDSYAHVTVDLEFAAHVSKAVKRAFYVISRSLRGDRWTPVYRSETICVNSSPLLPMRNNNCMRAFQQLRLPVRALSAGVYAKLLKIQVFSHAGRSGDHIKLSETLCSLEKVKSKKTPSVLSVHTEVPVNVALGRNPSTHDTPTVVLQDKQVAKDGSLTLTLRLLHY